MRKGLVHFIVFSLLTLGMWGVNAAERVPQQEADAIIASLNIARPDLQFGDLTKTPLEGVYRVTVNDQQFLHVSADGQFVITGDILQVRNGYLAPVQDFELDKKRKEALEALPEDDFLIFPAKDDQPKATVYVFTDIDCGFCRKLHMETVPGLNEAGVEVRYLAFPRAGVGSESYRKIATAWCSPDRKAALTRLKQGQPVAENVCEGNPVEAQYKLGSRLGVNGTPALVLSDGTLLPGFRSPEELLHILDLNVAQ